MKTIFIASLLILLLSSCSLFQRHSEENSASEEESSGNELENSAGDTKLSLATELSKVNSRVEALETRVDILTSRMEKNQIKASQPEISAEPNEMQATEAHEERNHDVKVKYVAPTKAAVAAASKDQQEVENKFQEGMELFQAGKNQEASAKFTALARQYPDSMLSAHALYWAGEASVRSQQWSSAVVSWEELEKNHPRSAYLPEALAGLSRAYDAQGDTQKAASYKTALLKSFPQSPATLNFTTHSSQNTESEAQENAESSSTPPSTATQVDE